MNTLNIIIILEKSKISKKIHNNNTNHFADTSHNVSPPQDQFTQFPTQMYNS